MSTNEPHIEEAITINPNLIGSEFVSVDVFGEPFAKQRPRAVRRGRFVKIYTPNETKNYEKKVAKAYRKTNGNKQLEGPITVEVEGTFSIPKSATKKRQEGMLAGIVPHTAKPDCDNMAKICLDALNGVAYPDDAAITKLVASKKYGLEPKIRITIYKKDDKESM